MWHIRHQVDVEGTEDGDAWDVGRHSFIRLLLRLRTRNLFHRIVSRVRIEISRFGSAPLIIQGVYPEVKGPFIRIGTVPMPIYGVHLGLFLERASASTSPAPVCGGLHL